jgi:hypothetical protein
VFAALRRHAVPQHDGMLAGARNRQIVDVTAGVFALLFRKTNPRRFLAWRSPGICRLKP